MLPLQTPLPTLPDSIPSLTQELEIAKNLPLDNLIDKVVSGVVSLAINIAIALIVFYVGKLLLHKLYKLLATVMAHRNVDRSLSTFVLSMVKVVLYFILIVTVIGILGIETSSFIAIFASAGVAVGMALSGTLQNFAGGVLILLLKPYKVGDYIEAQGYAGYVREIQIFSTIISTYDNKSIIIPNGGLSTGSINNWSREDYRRVEWQVSISYGDDIDAARDAITQILINDERIVKKYVEDDRLKYATTTPDANNEDATPSAEVTPEKRSHNPIKRMMRRHRNRVAAKVEAIRAENEQKIAAANPPVDRSPAVVVNALGSSSVDLVARAWTRSDFYWSVFYDINESIYKTLPTKGISFPFPQLDVHLSKPAGNN